MHKLLASAVAPASLLLLTAVALAGQAVSSSGQVQTLRIHHSSAQANKSKKASGVSVTISLRSEGPTVPSQPGFSASPFGSPTA